MIEILGLAILVNFYTFWFNPFGIQEWKNRQVDRLITWMIDKEYYWLQSLLRVLWCEKCLGFWTGLIYFQNIFIAAIVSFTAYIVKYIITYYGKSN